MNVRLCFPHSVSHDDLDSTSRLTSLEHIMVVLFSIVIEVSISKV